MTASSEQYDKYEQALYGRACVLHAGSLELLDLIGIYDRIADTGFIAKYVYPKFAILI